MCSIDYPLMLCSVGVVVLITKNADYWLAKQLYITLMCNEWWLRSIYESTGVVCCMIWHVFANLHILWGIFPCLLYVVSTSSIQHNSVGPWEVCSPYCTGPPRGPDSQIVHIWSSVLQAWLGSKAGATAQPTRAGGPLIFWASASPN